MLCADVPSGGEESYHCDSGGPSFDRRYLQDCVVLEVIYDVFPA
jgi:hypothetical protein